MAQSVDRMNADFSRTVGRLEYEIEDGLFTRGAQVVVEVDGDRLLDVALGDNGLGAAMEPEHVFRIYCTIKPIIAFAVARLVEAGSITLDDPLEQWLPNCRALTDGVTLRHVLTHTAGLHRPMGLPMEMVATDQRRKTVEKIPRPTAFRVGIDAAYSEYSGWHVVGWLIEALTGEPLYEYLRSEMLDPLGLHNTFIGMSDAEYRAVLPHLGVNHDVRDLETFPMLFERTARVCQETNPAHGGYSNARDLARFYTQTLSALAGNEVAGLPGTPTLAQFCSEARAAVYDQVLDRVCPYGLGVMTSLDQHAFGTAAGSNSFGHSGNSGASFAFADPDRGLAVAAVFNGLVGYDAAFLRRQALITALAHDLEDLDLEDAEVDLTNGEAGAPSRRRGLFSRRR
jgi:CubicO group peptidase (beta-lactamase class C family)